MKTNNDCRERFESLVRLYSHDDQTKESFEQFLTVIDLAAPELEDKILADRGFRIKLREPEVAPS